MSQVTSWMAVSLLISTSVGLNAPAAIAHQDLTVSDVRATIHLQPDDSPYAGEPSFTWFHLTTADAETIPLANCDCKLAVYNAENRLVSFPPLEESEVEGHEQPITTTITFPEAGRYQLVLTGESVNNQFAPFELTVPVEVRPERAAQSSSNNGFNRSGMLPR